MAIKIEDTKKQLSVLPHLPKNEASVSHFAMEISICKGAPLPARLPGRGEQILSPRSFHIDNLSLLLVLSIHFPATFSEFTPLELQNPFSSAFPLLHVITLW